MAGNVKQVPGHCHILLHCSTDICAAESEFFLVNIPFLIAKIKMQNDTNNLEPGRREILYYMEKTAIMITWAADAKEIPAGWFKRKKGSVFLW